MEESSLISKSEKFLNEISKESINISKLDDFEEFKSLYFKLDDRLSTLHTLRNQMDLQGYTTPFRSLSKYGNTTSDVVSLEEVSENSRHNQFFRMKANAKKNILDRVKSAIDSHQIAIGNLEQYGYVKCESCYKKYRMDEYKENGCKCSCGSEQFSFKINKDNSYRLEIIPFLPLSGNYRVHMTQFSNWGRDSFKKVLNLLKQERKGVVKSISLVIKFKDENNRWIRKNVTIDSDHVDNYEEEVRKTYGKNVRIEVLRFHRTKPAIIDDRHARTALAIGYVKYSEKLVNEMKDSIFKKRISDFKRLNKYNNLKHEIATKKPNFIDEHDTASLESWRKTEFEETCKKLKFMDKFGNLNRSLKRDLKIKENIEKSIFTNIAPTLIIWDIFRYYLTTSHNNRKITSGPFPYIRVELDRQQRKIFQTTYKKVIETLNEEINLKLIPIPEMDLVLYEKFKLEKLIKNTKMKINYPALGAGLIHKTTEIPIENIGNALNINNSKIKKEIKNIETIKKPKTEKSKKFLELIKK
ncbi:DUF530 domain-containing protein [Methanobrevibacter woesei]|uniref:DUF530 domain-containing protein n=1 Tax=Methanobrevibacter woesei TaxID=190976 RepID=UPI0024B67865|nr:DUF530 domain-containing protein [Methanobrevibacter woesei]